MAIIMSWSECSIESGKTGANDAMAASLTPIGTIKDKSTTMETTDGESMEMRKTGGKVVAYDESEGMTTITTRLIEPTFTEIVAILGTDSATNDATEGTLKLKSLIITDNLSVKLTPKNIGGVGIKARKCHAKYKEGYSETDGHYADLTFTILECEDNELYTKFIKKAT